MALGSIYDSQPAGPYCPVTHTLLTLKDKSVYAHQEVYTRGNSAMVSGPCVPWYDTSPADQVGSEVKPLVRPRKPPDTKAT